MEASHNEVSDQRYVGSRFWPGWGLDRLETPTRFLPRAAADDPGALLWGCCFFSSRAVLLAMLSILHPHPQVYHIFPGPCPSLLLSAAPGPEPLRDRHIKPFGCSAGGHASSEGQPIAAPGSQSCVYPSAASCSSCFPSPPFSLPPPVMFLLLLPLTHSWHQVHFFVSHAPTAVGVGVCPLTRAWLHPDPGASRCVNNLSTLSSFLQVGSSVSWQIHKHFRASPPRLSKAWAPLPR